MNNACGNVECRSSTSIGGGLTFGYGELDNNGFFEFPCRICSKTWTEQLANTKKAIIDRMVAEGESKEAAEEYVNEEEWLNVPSWPYV